MKKVLSELASCIQSRSKGLPRQCYFDTEYWQLECDRFLRPGWHAVGRAAEFQSVGDYKSATVLGEDIIIVRSDQNNIKAFSRVCRHRGCLLVEDDGNTDAFVCPYHNWKYDLAGALKTAPLMAHVEGFNPTNVQLAPVGVAQWQGFVFVNLEPNNNDDFPKSLGEFDEALAPFGLDQLVEVGCLSYECPWNWKVLVENFMESYHNLGVHPETLQPFYPAQNSSASPVKDLGTMLTTPGRNGESDVLICHIFPYLIFFTVKDEKEPITGWYEIKLKDATHFELNIRVLGPKSLSEDAQSVQGILDAISAYHAEDIVVCNQVQRGLQNRLYSPVALSNHEAALIHFHSKLAKSIC